jgi:putative transcriptional regulator
MNAVSKGTLLIAKPFLGDPNFERGVVLLCDYNPESSFGFVLNQVTDVFLGDVMEEAIYQDIPLYLGGPVEKNKLHFIHKRPDLTPFPTMIFDFLWVIRAGVLGSLMRSWIPTNRGL